VLRRPHNKQELSHYLPPNSSSPPPLSHLWLVQHSLHLQALQLSLPPPQTQSFALTTPLSTIHITPPLSQSVSSVLNRSSDSADPQGWIDVLTSGILRSHSLPPSHAPNLESVSLSNSKSLSGLTAHQLVSGTPFSDAVKSKSSSSPTSLAKATEYDQFNLTPLHYSVLSNNRAFFTEALVQNPTITTNFIVDDKNGVSIMDTIASRGEWLFLEVLMNWQNFQLTKCLSSKVSNPITTSLLAPALPATKLSNFVRTAHEGGFSVDYSIVEQVRIAQFYAPSIYSIAQ